MTSPDREPRRAMDRALEDLMLDAMMRALVSTATALGLAIAALVAALIAVIASPLLIFEKLRRGRRPRRPAPQFFGEAPPVPSPAPERDRTDLRLVSSR